MKKYFHLRDTEMDRVGMGVDAITLELAQAATAALFKDRWAKENSQLPEDKDWNGCLLAYISHRVKKPLLCPF